MLAIKNEKLSLDEIRDYASYFLERNYNMTLSIPITQNNRLTRALGRYRHTSIGGEAVDIQLSGKLLKHATNNIILDTLKHELIHHALHIQGKPYRDGQVYFENELKKHGVSSTNTNKVGEYFILECNNCKKESETYRTAIVNNLQRYTTKCCNEKMTYINNVIYNGE